MLLPIRCDDLVLTIIRQNAAIWDNMSSEERERYVAENSHLGNKRYVQSLMSSTYQSLTFFIELISVSSINTFTYVYPTRI
jgi:hypothetical protein